MTLRAAFVAFCCVALVSVASCSKTQDTAPDRRVFGAPPTILSVQTDNPNWFDPGKTIKCDFAETIKTQICLFGYHDLVVQPGDGWTLPLDPQHPEKWHSTDFGVPASPDPGVIVEGGYGEATFRVVVTDPDSPPKPQTSNILLVSASYAQAESNTENSLVVFDDGSFNQFSQSQKQTGLSQDCGVDPDGTCHCTFAHYSVTSGDETANDDHFTRKIALIAPTTEALLQDCIARDAHETLIIAPNGKRFEFKIEAVDRQGNLTEWPQKLVAVTPSTPNPFVCNGDSCGCCFLHFGGLDGACFGLPGLVSPDFPNGLCKAFG